MATENTKLNAEEKKQVLEYALPVGTVLTSKQRTYTVKEVLGVGGFGITYRVTTRLQEGNIDFQYDFAIKEHFMKGCYRDYDRIGVQCAPTTQLDFDQGREDFLEEAKRLHKLSRLSPNIVRVNEHFIANGTAYYVMEYLKGGDLTQYVGKNGPMSEGRALSIIVPIAKAVALLHDEHLLHLDIKPDNIVLKNDPESGSFVPVLIDFGISKHFNRNGKPTSKLVAKGASDGYAPIEQYTDITDFAPEIDVYALGATLYYLLTGKNPPKAFDIGSTSQLTDALPAAVSSRVRDAIASAMQKNKFDRTPSVRLLLSAIEKTHTLPVGYVLNAHGRRFRVVEILSEDNCSITYKAIETFTLDDSLQRNDDGRPSTEITRSFVMVEYFCKDRDRRLDDGIATTSEASMDSPEHDQFLSAVSRTAKVPVPQVRDSFNSHGEDSWQFVQANGTEYFIYEVKPQPPILKRLSGKIKIAALAGLLFGSLLVIWLLGNLKTPQTSDNNYDYENDLEVLIAENDSLKELMSEHDQEVAQTDSVNDHAELNNSPYGLAMQAIGELEKMKNVKRHTLSLAAKEKDVHRNKAVSLLEQLDKDTNKKHHNDIVTIINSLKDKRSNDGKKVTEAECMHVDKQNGEYVSIEKTNVKIDELIEKVLELAMLYPSVESVNNIKTFTVEGNGKSVTFNMVLVKAGTFQMGSTTGDSDEQPVHSVTLTKDYYMGETEVTQALWYAVIGEKLNSISDHNYGVGDNYPAYRISYEDCEQFIAKLNQMTGRQFRFPTEAEWEFAARGGTKSKGYTYAGSNNIGDVAWYLQNANLVNHKVKIKASNELGLYDMSGNVREWCYDWYGSYSSTAQKDPTGPISGSFRVLRGGSWNCGYPSHRVTSRVGNSADCCGIDYGFRLAMN